ncbi:MAG: diguanylate cyclase [Syntrophomonadaceae bacterium]|jgi:two-component system cell cycle response regulator
MIADDDALSRKVLEDSLLDWGYDVLVTRNGQEAWEVLSQPNHPNLIILDWMMPGYDGVDICRMLRRREGSRYTYVILLTSRDSRKDLVMGLESGVDDYITKPFDSEELKYRLRIGERIVALEERILSMARTDYLTDLLNRRAFMERLEGERNRSIRDGKNLSIILADIDFFKRVNDHYGHQNGDLVLQEFAKCLRDTCRQYDFVGRYGGEEFIIGLPGTGIEESKLIAERIRKIIEAHQIKLPDQNVFIQITSSFGVASITPQSQANFDDLIRSADQALYRAKNEGRNQVAWEGTLT